MFIDIDDAKIKEYVDSAVEKKVEALTDEIIQDRVQKALFDRVDGIFSAYNNDIRTCVDKHVREIVQEQVKIDSSAFNKAVGSISSKIATRLKTSIIESIAFNLMPDTEETDD